MKKLVNEIANQIEKRVNTWTEERDIKTYHVIINKGEDEVEVAPLEGSTLFCIDDLVKVAQFYGVSHYITVESTLVFRMYGIK